jgi:hypothetical protein
VVPSLTRCHATSLWKPSSHCLAGTSLASSVIVRDCKKSGLVRSDSVRKVPTCVGSADETSADVSRLARPGQMWPRLSMTLSAKVESEIRND